MSDRPPTVLHFITRFLRGGADRKTLLEIEGLREAYDFHLAHGAETDDAMTARVDELGVPRHTIDAMRHYDPLRVPAAVASFRRLVDDVEPDLVHVHSTEAGAVGRWALRHRDVPVVYTLHGMPFGPNRAWPLRAFVRFTERRLARHTTRFTANARAIAEAYLDAGVGRPDQYEVVYSGVDLDRLNGAEPADGLPGDSPRILFAGRLAPGKGARRLARAVERVRANGGPTASLLVAGTGPLRDELAALGHDWLHLLGYRDDLPSVMKSCDVLALSSDHEGTPRVVTEAMACGLPVVASRVGGIPEQVDDGESGLLVDPRDPAELVEALRTLLDDPGLRESLARSAAKRVERFSVDAMLETTDRLYQELLG